jgi:hypothetical protein
MLITALLLHPWAPTHRKWVVVGDLGSTALISEGGNVASLCWPDLFRASAWRDRNEIWAWLRMNCEENI